MSLIDGKIPNSCSWKTLDFLLVSCLLHCIALGGGGGGSLQLGAWQVSSIWQQTKIGLPSGSRRWRLLVQLSISLSLSLSNITYTPCLTPVARWLLAVGAGICQVCLQCVALGPSQVESVHFSLESLICCPLLVAFSSSICRTCLCVCVCVRPFINFHFPSISR